MKRIAIIGLGSIGLRHAENLLSMGHTDICAVDTRPFPNETRFPVLNDIRAAGRWSPTHVLVCTPPQWHYMHAVRFLASGIPTFIEKPITTSLGDARALCTLAKKEKTVLAVGYMERAHPVVQRVKQWYIENQRSYISIRCYWMASRKTYALDVVHESSHAIDTAIFIKGTLGKVRAYSRSETSASMEWGSNRSRISVTMNMAARPCRIISAYDEYYNVFREEYGTTPEEWDLCYKSELQAFLDGKPLCTGQDGLAVVEVMEHLTNGISYA